MDVGDWLRSLGLGQYESAFRENEIDGDVLPTLTAEDLKELGVVALGHRRKLLSESAKVFTQVCRRSVNYTNVPIRGKEACQLGMTTRLDKHLAMASFPPRGRKVIEGTHQLLCLSTVPMRQEGAYDG